MGKLQIDKYSHYLTPQGSSANGKDCATDHLQLWIPKHEF